MKKNPNGQTFILALKNASRDCFQNYKCNTPQAMIMIVAGIIFSFLCQIANGQTKTKTESWEDKSNEESYTVTYDTATKKDGSIETCTRWVISGRGILTHIDSCTDHQTGYSTIYKNVYWTTADGKKMKRRTLVGFNPSHKKIYEEIQTFCEISVDSLIQVDGILKKGDKVYVYDSTAKKYLEQPGEFGSVSNSINKASEKNISKELCNQQSEILVKGNYEFAESSKDKGMFGFAIAYKRPISSHFEAVIQSGFASRSQSNGEVKSNDSRIDLLAGISFFPLNKRECRNQIIFGTQVLVGFENEEIMLGEHGHEHSIQMLQADIGASLDWKPKQVLKIRLAELNYAPVLYKGNLQNYLTVGIGIAVSFGQK